MTSRTTCASALESGMNPNRFPAVNSRSRLASGVVGRLELVFHYSSNGLERQSRCPPHGFAMRATMGR
jgi:hypothetical protein